MRVELWGTPVESFSSSRDGREEHDGCGGGLGKKGGDCFAARKEREGSAHK